MSEPRTLTPLAVAALALLAEGPSHPYEMYQTLMQRSEDRLVKVRPGSLYHTVDRMEAHGFVRATGTEREGNRPERTTYEITDAGTRALGERITEIIGTPTNEYPEFPLGLGEAHNLPIETVIALLRKRVALIRADTGVLDGAIADLTQRGVPAKYWLDVRYQRAITATEADVLETLIADLQSGAVSWSEEKH
ncbi:DNA-binding transcriptional regulator, PadR family [Leifsonia sp. 98AMF]|uniref:PadR family transcriptional regulator n=1 Tax=unclassified Leifsonia TaxID=2663824 RepID=UPI00087BFBEB|nr:MULTISPECIES: PadR family transcriptional regulator [unclassified Leifsonia]SDH67522.1 DNA-binding transcriptional regulator, PadR family [Leifsonia sp. 197AMF]SDI72160.1 DNA-binding transcriptional regulator, PadR family [Leifsonia sp. 466MF]SDK17192.1 DNA-binding transcriptional regulator, PadR family [Leifsonia sp. 157MF]SDN74969.1 DNA-binding transcriptional regulator, PadR family [Leifsonia sp. 509MF]SEN33248.1 DNA-binding transcriptional regulator, PadR family [Leifsonia sp. 467MF]